MRAHRAGRSHSRRQGSRRATRGARCRGTTLVGPPWRGRWCGGLPAYAGRACCKPTNPSQPSLFHQADTCAWRHLCNKCPTLASNSSGCCAWPLARDFEHTRVLQITCAYGCERGRVCHPLARGHSGAREQPCGRGRGAIAEGSNPPPRPQTQIRALLIEGSHVARRAPAVLILAHMVARISEIRCASRRRLPAADTRAREPTHAQDGQTPA